MEEFNKSHSLRYTEIQTAVKDLEDKIIKRGDLSYISTSQQVYIIQQLASFPMGQHILLTGGANAFWTDYMIAYPQIQKNLAASMLNLNRLEYYIIFECLSVLAQRELFRTSQKIAQKHLKDNATLASIPCGLMRDFLELDFSKTNNVQLLGADLDLEAMEHAKKLASNLNITNIEFTQQNAWNLKLPKQVDYINSIGLNVYEEDRARVIELYKQFYDTLKPSGILFTGVLTYPPGSEKPSDWSIDILSPEQIEMEKIIIEDIYDLTFQNYRTLDEIKDDFFKAGFKKVEVTLDKFKVFPAIVATK